MRRIVKNNPSITDLENDLKVLVNEIIEKLKPKAIILAGSIARGKFIRDMNDIDMFLIVEKINYRTLLKAVKDVNVEITMYTYDEALESIKRGNQFVKDAIENGILLLGREILDRIRHSSEIHSKI
ncbi:MAG: nucleotidyltransferase domain-containing protein [Candidatus Methanomethylicia archaeon]